MSSSSHGSNNDTSKLLMTAIGAALTGATIAIVAMKYADTSRNKKEEYLQYHIPKQQQLQHRNSLVFARDESEHGSSSTTNGQTILFPHNHEEKMRRTIAARALVEEDNFHPRDSVTVRVPATSANMGPGCTCLFDIAWFIYDEFNNFINTNLLFLIYR
jgi:hypothetical protein